MEKPPAPKNRPRPELKSVGYKRDQKTFMLYGTERKAAAKALGIDFANGVTKSQLQEINKAVAEKGATYSATIGIRTGIFTTGVARGRSI